MTDTTATQLDAILAAAATYAPVLAAQSGATRADMLRDVADALDAARDELVEIAEMESHLPAARLVGEVARTSGQLRFLGDVIVDGGWRCATIDTADPNDAVLKPDVRSLRVPLGVALVFTAGNFPFAFSVAGGDTASALAAGCPVVVKAHPGHPQLSTRVAALVHDVFGDAFALIEGVDAGRRAIVDPRVKVASFTGSLAGGRALFDLAAGRPDPIPFYGELGSINPVFVTPNALRARGEEIADGYVASFTLATGQMCTKPGLLFLPHGHDLAEVMATRVGAVGPATMLEERIATSHAKGRAALRATPGVRVLVETPGDGEANRPAVLTAAARDFIAAPELADEHFGPTSLVVEYGDGDELVAAARRVEGSLTATIHSEAEDTDLVERLVGELRPRVGRLVFNGWPTGVRVTWAMQHGGPWPASTSAAHTSVGAAAIDRFTRPIAFQSAPQAHLPPELRDHNELGILRRVDGALTTNDVPPTSASEE